MANRKRDVPRDHMRPRDPDAGCRLGGIAEILRRHGASAPAEVGGRAVLGLFERLRSDAAAGRDHVEGRVDRSRQPLGLLHAAGVHVAVRPTSVAIALGDHHFGREGRPSAEAVPEHQKSRLVVRDEDGVVRTGRIEIRHLAP